MIFGNNNIKLLLMIGVTVALICLLYKNNAPVVSNAEAYEQDQEQEQEVDSVAESLRANLDIEDVEAQDDVDMPHVHVNDSVSGLAKQFEDNLRGTGNEQVSNYDTGYNLAELNKADTQAYRTTVGDQEFKHLSKQLDKSFMELAHGYDYYMPPKPSQLSGEQRKNFSNIDLEVADLRLDHDNLINTDRYTIGTNTVGASLKNATYDLRPAPPNPKITVSPWLQSTYQPDYNTRPL
jgi:hypothetical protein